ncbi:TPA: hypothetical protein PXM22_004221 [Yersinia enterocolitica]|nr:hypothetical protein [Yersinia enterocolitica]
MIVNEKNRFTDRAATAPSCSSNAGQQGTQVIILADKRKEREYQEASKRVSEAASKINW